MEFRSAKYKIISVNKQSKSKWLKLITEGDIIQFVVYSQGRSGSGTTFNLLVNDNIKLLDESKGKENNSFGSNILYVLMKNIEAANLGFK